MLYDKIVLSQKDILEQDFKIDTRGYRPQEVDKYLDIIIKDYTEFFNIIGRLESENKALTEENLNLKHEMRSLRANVEISRSTDSKPTNVDVLRRLSQLEKVVYGGEEE